MDGSANTLPLAHSIDSVKHILQNEMGLVIKFTNIFGEGHHGSTLAPVTCNLFCGLAAFIFDGHGMGRTWNGNYGIESMYVVDKCYFAIAVKPQILPASNLLQFEPRKADLKQLVSHFRPHLDCREIEKRQGEPQYSDYPVYFPELCHDIENVTKGELESSWFREFVLNNPGLKLPVARHNFVCGTQLLLQGPVDLTLSQVFSTSPCSEIEDDWCDAVSQSKIHLVEYVYNFIPLTKADGEKGKTGENGGKEGTKGRAGGANGSPKRHFRNTIRSIITYDRNLKQHAPQIVLVKTSISEVEVFSATILVKYIHKTIKLLLKKNLISGEIKDIWEEYKSSSSKTIDGSEPQPGRLLSFWD